MPKPPSVIAGQCYARLTAIELIGLNRIRRPLWRFRCECGGELVALAPNVKSGKTRSCGCLKREATIETGHANATHGMTKTREYRTWNRMIERCEHEKREGFDLYGGRGIGVCERWRSSFEAFLSDMGPQPSPRHSLDRYPDKDGDYEPRNCRWATLKEQARNKRNNRWVSVGGRQVTVAEAAEKFGISRSRVLTLFA